MDALIDLINLLVLFCVLSACVVHVLFVVLMFRIIKEYKHKYHNTDKKAGV